MVRSIVPRFQPRRAKLATQWWTNPWHGVGTKARVRGIAVYAHIRVHPRRVWSWLAIRRYRSALCRYWRESIPPLRHHESVGVLCLRSRLVVSMDGIALQGHAHRIVAAVSHWCFTAGRANHGRRRIILEIIFIALQLETIMRRVPLWPTTVHRRIDVSDLLITTIWRSRPATTGGRCRGYRGYSRVY